MGHKYNGRKRQHRDQRGPPPATEPEQSLSHRRLEERAVRDGWLQDGSERARIMSRMLLAFEDDETGVRYLVAIGKTLIYADLGQQRIDLQRETIADRQTAAARAAGETASEASGAEPPKRIIIPDADDRLPPRED